MDKYMFGNCPKLSDIVNDFDTIMFKLLKSTFLSESLPKNNNKKTCFKPVLAHDT